MSDDSDNLDHELFEKLTKMTEAGALTENDLVRIGEWKTANYKVDYYKKEYEEVQADFKGLVEYIEQKCNEWAQSRRERSRAQSGRAEKRARSK
tara:strand:- start:513 stop:794 length:282 start_codon:yes stop_codon:yes gene_type:complete